MSNGTDTDRRCTERAPCDAHNLKEIKNVFVRLFKTCSVCKVGRGKGSWPWSRMVRCRNCKMVSHRRCANQGPAPKPDRTVEQQFRTVQQQADELAEPIERVPIRIVTERLTWSAERPANPDVRRRPRAVSVVYDSQYYRNGLWHCNTKLVNDRGEKYYVVTTSVPEGFFDQTAIGHTIVFRDTALSQANRLFRSCRQPSMP